MYGYHYGHTDNKSSITLQEVHNGLVKEPSGFLAHSEYGSRILILSLVSIDTVKVMDRWGAHKLLKLKEVYPIKEG